MRRPPVGTWTAERIASACAWLSGRPRLAAATGLVGDVRRVSRQDRIGGLAAEVAFFALLSVFPSLLAVAAAVGAFGTFVGEELAAEVEREVTGLLTVFLSERGAGTVEAVRELFEQGRGGVFSIAVAGALWAATRGMAAVLRTLTQIYDFEVKRSPVRTRLVALLLAAGTMLLIAVVLVMVVVGPLLGAGRRLAGLVGLAGFYGAAWEWIGLPLAFLALLGWSAVIFHSVPHNHRSWRPHLAGAACTGVVWLAVSLAFRLYLHLFGGNPVFGILGGALVVLLWMYVLSLGLLVGAEVSTVLHERSLEAGEEDRRRTPGYAERA